MHTLEGVILFETMNQYILQKKKEKNMHKALVRNGWIAFFLFSIIVIVTSLLLNTCEKKKYEKEFKKYYDSITLEEENFDNEIATLIGYLENDFLSEESKALASDMISVMYSINNNVYESISYMCKALYYYSQINKNVSVIQMAVNLSATLILATSYDMAETLLNGALDIELTPEEKMVYHVFIYTNLAESMSQRRHYDQAIEAIQLGESKLRYLDEAYFWDCVLSLNISKALSYLGLGDVKKCEEILAGINKSDIERNLKNQITFGIPYCEVQSYLNLHQNNLKASQKYFEQYIAYCDGYQYNSLKLFYIKKYTELAKKLGYDTISFTKKYEDDLIQMYQDELQRSNNETAKTLLDSYSVASENLTIHSKQRQTRMKILGVSTILLTLVMGSITVLIRIRKKSQVDFLTGAYNRVKLRQVYRSLLKRKQEFYVMMFDIDNFKNCNDTYGHRFGDTVLEQIAQTVNLILPKASMLFRYGGEEFVVLCETKSREELKELAEFIRRSVEELTWETGTKITISIGVSTSEGVADPLRTADECLYQSKNTGKNKITYFFESK